MARRKGFGPKLVDVHIRVPEDRYEKIKKICEDEGITIATFFNFYGQERNFKRLFEYADSLDLAPRRVIISYDNDLTKYQIEEIIKAMNTLAGQVRRVGQNLGYIIRDIRSGRVSCNDPRLLPTLEQNLKAIKSLEANYNRDASHFLQSILMTKGIRQELELRQGGR